MPIPLREFEIWNFKSYSGAKFPLAPLTMLIGANASGKSNAIEGLRLLSWLARGNEYAEFGEAVHKGHLRIRGGVADLTREGLVGFYVSCALEGGRKDWNKYFASFRIKDSNLIPDREALRDEGGAALFELLDPVGKRNGEATVAYNDFSTKKTKPRIPCSSAKAILTQLNSPARFGATHKKSQRVVPEAVQATIDALKAIFFLDPNPSAMRGYCELASKELREDASNVSAILYHLTRTKAGKDEVLQFVRELPEQNIGEVGFHKTERDDVMVRLYESHKLRGGFCDAPLLSDGTLRVLAIASAILSVPEGSTLVLEEVDTGVHPTRVGALVANMQRVALKRSLRVLLTTHNPAVLDALPSDALGDALFCFRDPEFGHSEAVRLDDMHNYPELVARGSLGQILTQGILDRMAKAKEVSASVKAKNALDFLESLSTSRVS